MSQQEPDMGQMGTTRLLGVRPPGLARGGIHPMRIFCAVSTVARLAFWILAIGILFGLAVGVQSVPAEPASVTWTSACDG